MTIAIVATAFGGPEVLSAVQIDVPPPAPGEVTVDVRAAGVNPADNKIIGGRFGADPARLPLPVGRELAGVVSAVGLDATGPAGPIAVGDEVVVYPVAGAFAEAITVPAAAVVPKPKGLSWEEGAGLLLAGATALHTVAAVGLREGDTVLIHGAAGSVGQLAVQLAAQSGAAVIGTASARNHALLRELGAIPVGYGPGLADRVRALAPSGVTAAIDTVGTDEAIDVSLELVADPERVISIATGRADVRRLGGGPGADPGTRIRANAWRTLLPAAASGALRLPIARTYPLADAAKALRFVQEGHAAGKVILLP